MASSHDICGDAELIFSLTATGLLYTKYRPLACLFLYLVIAENTFLLRFQVRTLDTSSCPGQPLGWPSREFEWQHISLGPHRVNSTFNSHLREACGCCQTSPDHQIAAFPSECKPPQNTGFPCRLVFYLLSSDPRVLF